MVFVCHIAYLSLGSNIGDRLSHLRLAVERLHTGRVHVTGVSSVYETEPVGYDTPQPVYLNLGVQVRTSLDPESLLQHCLHVETLGGRQREWDGSPRTIDIDVILYDDLCWQTPTLTVPHPRMHERAFVLAPLLEIDATLTTPDGQALATLLQQPPACYQQITQTGPAWLPGTNVTRQR